MGHVMPREIKVDAQGALPHFMGRDVAASSLEKGEDRKDGAEVSNLIVGKQPRVLGERSTGGNFLISRIDRVLCSPFDRAGNLPGRGRLRENHIHVARVSQ